MCVQREGSNSGVLAGKKVKAVMGTDGDLRKLTLSRARTVLRNFGVAEEEVSQTTAAAAAAAADWCVCVCVCVVAVDCPAHALGGD